MSRIRAGKIPEFVIYILLWLLFLIIPLVTNNYNIKGGFQKICYDWLRLVPFIIVFTINNFLLLRKLLFRGKTLLYAASLFSAAIIVAGSFYFLNPLIHKNDPRILEERILRDPQWGREEMNPVNPATGPGTISPNPELFNPGPGDMNQLARRVLPSDQTFYAFLNTLIISLLIAGFNTAIAVTNRWFTEEQARKEIEKEHVESKLAFLQNQVNPHFLMNTLNNIHSLIEADQNLAQNAVLKLSEMMRYLLYESGRGSTTLKKEIDFLNSYLELMLLRVDRSVVVTLDLPESFSNVDLPPLLFIPFIENAFKHGVSYREPSALTFRLVQDGGTLNFTSVNTISSFRSAENKNTSGGFGLENIRKRLDILYGNRYKLDITTTEHEFKVNLIIPT